MLKNILYYDTIIKNIIIFIHIYLYCVFGVNEVENLQEVWNAVLTALRGSMSEASITTWLTDVKPVDLNETALVLNAGSEFRQKIICQRFVPQIEAAAEAVLGFPCQVEVCLPAEAPAETSDANVQQPTQKALTFESFVVGPTNRFAYEASHAVAEHPGTLHNPLFIYGESGLGKTHLLKAIGAEMHKRFPSMNILYTSGENFFNEMLDHMRNKSMADFHNKFRTVDALLVDDIQFISAKPVAQEEFFYTFEALSQNNKQIVLTSDRPPRDIASLEDRLRSRFIQGLLADIQPPLLETRIAIIKQSAENYYHMTLSPEVIQYIAERLKNNVRQIEGVVQKLDAIRTLGNRAITIGVANDVIKDVIYYAQPTEVTINNILEEVAKSFGVSTEDIRGERKTTEISLARQAAIYIIRETTNLTLDDIGKIFSKKHSTVLYSIEAIETKMDDNADLKNNIYDIMKKIKSEREG